MTDDIAISLTNISKVFKQYASPADRLKEILFPGRQKAESFWALQDINLEISKGEAVAIIGRNGSGKSTLLQIIAGTLRPTTGHVNTQGRVAALLELGSGFDPEFTGHQNIFFNGRIVGLSQPEIEARYDQIVAFADIGDFIHKPVKTYSSGMFVRLAFAVQANIDASIVIIDEALAVGDVFFRQKCYARLEQLRSMGAAILLVSHSMSDVQQYCQRAVLLTKGVQSFSGSSSEATKRYYLLHQSEGAELQIEPEANEPNPDVSKPETHTEPLPLAMRYARKVPASAWLDLSQMIQTSDGHASCLGVALCRASGRSHDPPSLEPCNVFRQGDRAVIYYTFVLHSPVDVPIFGVVLKNERGIIVHGKNSWQRLDSVMPTQLAAGDEVFCRQEIDLNLEPGDYTFDLGLASVPLDIWQNRDQISHHQVSASRMRLCHLTDVSAFSINLALHYQVERLTHYGVADLPGTLAVSHFSQSSTTTSQS